MCSPNSNQPVLQHALLFLTAGVGAERYGNIAGNYVYSLEHFTQLPLLIWVYVAMMWTLGAIPVVSGLFSKSETGVDRSKTKSTVV